nr:hypothetical protein [Tanacetum cinerariifolium]
EAVLDAEDAVEGGRDFAALEEHGAPYFFDGEVAALLFAVGTEDAVGAVVAVGVEDAALVHAVEHGVEVEVVAAFVAVYPADDAGVGFVLGHHFFGEPGAGGRVVGRVPAGHFIEHEQAQRVAGGEEMVVGRVVR